MLGLLLIYFIGKYFYDLAGKYSKHRWGFAIAGVAAYYFGTFLAGILLALYYEFYSTSTIESMNDLALSLIALPFGLLTCWGLYAILENQWKKQPAPNHYDILDEDFME